MIGRNFNRGECSTMALMKIEVSDVDGRAGIAYVLLHTVVNFFIIDLCQKKSATWILCIFFYPIFPMLQKICYIDSMYLLPFYAIQICYMDFMYLIPSYLFYATSHYISLILIVLSHIMIEHVI